MFWFLSQLVVVNVYYGHLDYLQILYLGGGNSNIFYFHPDPWGNDPIWRAHIFQMGWFNHQPVICFCHFKSGVYFNQNQGFGYPNQGFAYQNQGFAQKKQISKDKDLQTLVVRKSWRSCLENHGVWRIRSSEPSTVWILKQMAVLIVMSKWEKYGYPFSLLNGPSKGSQQGGG